MEKISGFFESSGLCFYIRCRKNISKGVVRGRFIHKDWTSAAKYTIIFYKRVKGGLLLKNKAFVSFLLAVCLILNSVCAVFANETIELYKTVHIAQERTADYLKQTVPEPVFALSAANG